MSHNTGREAVVSEMKGADFGDARLSLRLGYLVDQILEAPDESFPDLFEEGDLEAAYRFFGNGRVSAERILAPHYAASVRRLSASTEPLILYDTTEFEFRGEKKRRGLGLLRSQNSQGFYGHIALAVSSEFHREPYGVLGMSNLVRESHRVGERTEADFQDPQRESLRWGALIKTVKERLPAGTRPIHVMDREADIFELLHQICQMGERYVIRAKSDRRLVGEEGELLEQTLFARMDMEVTRAQRDAKLSRRKVQKPAAYGSHPAREGRVASLDVKAARVRLRPPSRFQENNSEPKWLEVNVVLVVETAPPEGEAPVVWRLVTSEPIKTEKDLFRIIDAYRGRWVIEEFFKALKTGCAYEKRQLESFDSLENALAVFIPVAWHMLLLRTMARQKPDSPASKYMSKAQLAVLRKSKRAKLPKRPTTFDALMAVARLGGFLKHNGTPGWIVLGRGYQKLLALEEGWLLAGGRM